jgi:DHA1 family bicyclomycin/chloramphenicol resistance-like MFS transporter
MAPFPKVAGAAAALMGFAQMGGGLVGGLIGASVGDPSVGLGMIAPVMALTATGAYLVWRALPDDARQAPEAALR